ncbi:rhodanese-like domain-containing protein [Aidingimonas halophila]|uniref:Thiosulfate/3-mercaptopyruvate sulfurtransferase n=1 Tax=Aidingimonas halophila TaxID=574349 RepID=A0A1H2SBD7_9GAMM|nr:rhodanese-like domain-containing protein [Aidingimonas halophila]GHC17901.1 hypothetical protein GCM10008094_04520 [Aidingimonas halophila]SDW28890.1 thiosulfate/3-mercaptopyruvate sulfurtransferase [Aidingimonas halophila]
MTYRLILVAVSLCISSQAIAGHVPPLVDAEWLDERLHDDDLAVLDVRSSIDEGGDRESFIAARIPGSRYSNYTDDGWRESRNDVAGLMPDVDQLEQLIGGLGISNDSTVVIVPAGTGPTDFSWLDRASEP